MTVEADMPEDPDDNTAMWTEELIVENAAAIINHRRHLQSAVNNVINRTQRRREKLLTTGTFDEEELQHLAESDLENKCFNYFCAFCLQRYQTHSIHSAKLCKEGRLLRKLATFAHHNNGAQPAAVADTE